MLSKKAWSRNALENKQTIKHIFLPFYFLYIHTHTHTHLYIYIYIYTYTGTYIDKYPRTHTHTHTHTHIYIYIYIYTYKLGYCWYRVNGACSLSVSYICAHQTKCDLLTTCVRKPNFYSHSSFINIFGSVSLLNAISTFAGYLMPKSSL